MSRRPSDRAQSAPRRVGGRRAVLEAVRSGRALGIAAWRGAHGSTGLRDVLDAAARAGVPVRWVDRPSIEALGVPDHQGVVATLALPTEMDDRGLAAFDLPADALAVVLDGITDPQNLGACARAAEAAGASVLVARSRRAAPVSTAAVRASAGALLHLPLARVTNLTRTVHALQARGFSVVGLDHRAAASIHDAPPPPRPLALVVGAEGEGISRLVREACDLLVAIPMPGRTGSLNAASALAVALFGYVLRPAPGAG